MSRDDRYSVERVKDRLWVVVDRTRQGRPVSRSSDEDGARRIVSLLLWIGSGSGGRDGGGGVCSRQAA